MLTSQDLLVLRAALTFWYEEMGLYNSKAIAEYAGVDKSRLTIAESEIKDLAMRLRYSDIRYVLADKETRALTDTVLSLSPPTIVEQHFSIASVLIPTQSNLSSQSTLK